MTQNEIGEIELGFLLNFGDELMKKGITRTTNEPLDESLRALVPW